MSEEPKGPQPPAGGEGGAEDDAAAKAAEVKAKAEAAAKAKAEREAAEAAKPPWERDPAPPSREPADGDSLVESLREAFGEAIEEAVTIGADLVVTVRRASIREVCALLKAEKGYQLIVDLCGAHYPKREEAVYEVIYHLYSMDVNRRIRLKVKAGEGEEVPSVSPVWAGADWLEREVYDMFGLRFSDHPDMTRILMWEGFNGHPLRKDFPVEGIDTGTAIYPEYYEEAAGPVTGTGTGWKPPKPPEPPAEPETDTED